MLLAVVLLAAGGAAYAASQGAPSAVACSGASCTTGSGSGGTGSGGGGAASRSGHRQAQGFTVSSTTPAAGATGIPSNSKLAVTFDSAIERGGRRPALSPAVAGSWRQVSKDKLVFTPSEPFVPYKTYTLTVPGGTGGIASLSGAHLAATRTISFTISAGSTLRLQQLLAELGYLPVSYDGATPAPEDMATPQPGTFAWRWSGLPSELTDQWVAGEENAITKGAVMMFETENGLTVDGLPGPNVWTTLLHDVATGKANTEPVSYVLVTKDEPEHLTAWVNGSLAFGDIPVNTGVAGAPTTDGTFQVFEHVRYSDMRGTNVTGSHYTDPHVPWASYFDGGEALHGFPRASYGWPQSNGCVEMQITTAGRLWPYTAIGTLVTVVGPNAAGTPPAAPTTTTTTSTSTTTTSTTTSTTTTTTTAPPTTVAPKTTAPTTTPTTTTPPPTTTPTTTTAPTTAPATTTATTTAPTTTTALTTTTAPTVHAPSSQTPVQPSTSG